MVSFWWCCLPSVKMIGVRVSVKAICKRPPSSFGGFSQQPRTKCRSWSQDDSVMNGVVAEFQQTRDERTRWGEGGNTGVQKVLHLHERWLIWSMDIIRNTRRKRKWFQINRYFCIGGVEFTHQTAGVREKRLITIDHRYRKKQWVEWRQKTGLITESMLNKKKQKNNFHFTFQYRKKSRTWFSIE